MVPLSKLEHEENIAPCLNAFEVVMYIYLYGHRFDNIIYSVILYIFVRVEMCDRRIGVLKKR